MLGLDDQKLFLCWDERFLFQKEYFNFVFFLRFENDHIQILYGKLMRAKIDSANEIGILKVFMIS